MIILVFLIGFGPSARTPWYTPNEMWEYQFHFENLDNVALGCLFGLLTNRLSQSLSFRRSRWAAVRTGHRIAHDPVHRGRTYCTTPFRHGYLAAGGLINQAQCE